VGGQPASTNGVAAEFYREAVAGFPRSILEGPSQSARSSVSRWRGRGCSGLSRESICHSVPCEWAISTRSVCHGAVTRLRPGNLLNYAASRPRFCGSNRVRKPAQHLSPRSVPRSHRPAGHNDDHPLPLDRRRPLTDGAATGDRLSSSPPIRKENLDGSPGCVPPIPTAAHNQTLTAVGEPRLPAYPARKTRNCVRLHPYPDTNLPGSRRAGLDLSELLFHS